MRETKLVMATDSKTVHFDLPKDDGISLKYEIYFIVTCNEFSAENKLKNKIRQLMPKYKHENDIHEHRKQKNQ